MAHEFVGPLVRVALADDGEAQPVEPDAVEEPAAAAEPSGPQEITIVSAQYDQLMQAQAVTVGVQLVSVALLCALLGAAVGRELFRGL